MSPHPNLLCCLSICENTARVCEVLSNVSILSFFLNFNIFILRREEKGREVRERRDFLEREKY